MIFEVILVFVFILLASAYYLLISFVVNHWHKNTLQKVELNHAPFLKFSIVVCARNEEENIAACLKSLAALNYPKNLFEILVVDDHSEDKTAEIIETYKNVRLLSLSDFISNEDKINSYKKEALKYGIDQSVGHWIVTTDADCIVSPNWLKSIAAFQSKYELDFIGGPVIIKSHNNPFGRFESLDYLGMMGLTAAGIESGKWFMANGANMAFSKARFQTLDVYNEEYASGDDIFLVRAFAESQYKIGFNPAGDASVYTRGNDSFSDFFKQRIRWGTKNKTPGSLSEGLMMSLPFIISLGVIILCVWSFKSITALVTLSFVLFIKLAIDYYYLSQLAQHFKQGALLKNYPISAVIHILYISFFGLASLLIKNYSWKGRTVK